MNPVMMIREKYKEKLQKKTGWGKNEAISLLDDVITEVFTNLYYDDNMKQHVDYLPDCELNGVERRKK